MNKDLRSMTVKEIKAYMQENNIKITGAYKMKKAELIEAIEIIESVDEKINSIKLKTYKADYEDENFVVITAYSDEEAVDEAFSYENEHGALFNLFEVDDNYDEIREIKIDDFYNIELDIETEENKEETKIMQADDKTQEILEAENLFIGCTVDNTNKKQYFVHSEYNINSENHGLPFISLCSHMQNLLHSDTYWERDNPNKTIFTRCESDKDFKAAFEEAIKIVTIEQVKNQVQKNTDLYWKIIKDNKLGIFGLAEEELKYNLGYYYLGGELKGYAEKQPIEETKQMYFDLKKDYEALVEIEKKYTAPPVIDISTLYTCKFKLGGADEDTSRWDESDAEYFEMDLRYFDSFIDKLDAKYGDRLDKIDDYRYTVSNLSDDELGELESLFNELDNDMDYCWISYDFIEVEAA